MNERAHLVSLLGILCLVSCNTAKSLPVAAVSTLMQKALVLCRLSSQVSMDSIIHIQGNIVASGSRL